VGLKKILEDASLGPLGGANAVLLDGRPELTLVCALECPLAVGQFSQSARHPFAPIRL
jgi:hypothetical protein